MAYPVRTVIRPAVLAGQSNGRLDPAVLVDTPGQLAGPTVRLVAPAARAWRALQAAALAAGHILKATAAADSYRPYTVQERIFRERYTTTVLSGRPSVLWLGKRWYQRPNTAVAAVPGTSNHGWALAVDTGEERDSDAAAEPLDDATLGWLLAHEEQYGWSHELQSEPWHIRYWAGDTIPPAVLAYEQSKPTEEDDMKIEPHLVWCNEGPNRGMFEVLTGTGTVRAVGDASGFEAIYQANGWDWEKVVHTGPTYVTASGLLGLGRVVRDTDPVPGLDTAAVAAAAKAGAEAGVDEALDGAKVTTTIATG